MTKYLIAALALATLTGCNSHQETAQIKFVVTPDIAAGTVTVACKQSSSDTCHIAFTENMEPLEAAVKVGDSFAFHGNLSNTLYCAEISKPTLSKCGKVSIGLKRQTVTKSTSTDEGL